MYITTAAMALKWLVLVLNAENKHLTSSDMAGNDTVLCTK